MLQHTPINCSYPLTIFRTLRWLGIGFAWLSIWTIWIWLDLRLYSHLYSHSHSHPIVNHHKLNISNFQLIIFSVYLFDNVIQFGNVFSLCTSFERILLNSFVKCLMISKCTISIENTFTHTPTATFFRCEEGSLVDRMSNGKRRKWEQRANRTPKQWKTSQKIGKWRAAEHSCRCVCTFCWEETI